MQLYCGCQPEKGLWGFAETVLRATSAGIRTSAAEYRLGRKASRADCGDLMY